MSKVAGFVAGEGKTRLRHTLWHFGRLSVDPKEWDKGVEAEADWLCGAAEDSAEGYWRTSPAELLKTIRLRTRPFASGDICPECERLLAPYIDPIGALGNLAK